MVTSTACICSVSCFCRTFTDLSAALSLNTFQQPQRHIKISINAWGHGHPWSQTYRLTPTGWLWLPEIILLPMFLWYAGLIKKRLILSNTVNSTQQLMKCQDCGWDMDKKNRVGEEEGEFWRQRPGCPQLSQVFNQTCLPSWGFSFITKPCCQFVRIKTPWTKHTAHVLMGQGGEQTNMNVPTVLFWRADEDSVDLQSSVFFYVKAHLTSEQCEAENQTRHTSAADNRQRSNSPLVKPTLNNTHLRKKKREKHISKCPPP